MLLKKIFLAIFLSFLVLLGSWYYHNQNVKNIVSGVVSNPLDSLKRDGDRTNLLLMGIGGAGHEGSDLTDSILFVSINLSTSQATMIPIPRDLWIPSLRAKINTAYHYGNERRENGGRDLVKSAAAEILGLPIHYALVLDFNGFIRLIDALGGIDVDVERSFDDYKYPIPGKETAEPESLRYEHIHFEAGLAHMDGATALKFSRSRHALGDEGTDFARANRQGKVIQAIRTKVLSTDIFLSSDKLQSLKNVVIGSLDTDITPKEQGSFAKVLLGLGSKDNLLSFPLTDFLTSPKNTKAYGGQWVLVPTPSLPELQSYVKTQLAK